MRFFELFLKIRTDDASLISGGMLFQIFALLKQIERKPYCSVLFLQDEEVSTSTTAGVVGVHVDSLYENVNEIKWGNVVLASIYKYRE